ncbi:kinase-like domain-containing protein, partial [Lactarius indigo]
ELLRAVEWMHARFVVHRDIKLETIDTPCPDFLLTANRFVSLPAEDKPLVKLTDFGLSRKIDPDDPWLSTHCGSESYAAPELLPPRARTPDTYDGRETDPRALGVVLFAL